MVLMFPEVNYSGINLTEMLKVMSIFDRKILY